MSSGAVALGLDGSLPRELLSVPRENQGIDAVQIRLPSRASVNSELCAGKDSVNRLRNAPSGNSPD